VWKQTDVEIALKRILSFKVLERAGNSPFEIEICVKRHTEMGRGGNGHLQDVIGLLLIDADGNILRSTLAEVWSCQQPCSSLKSIFILLVLQSR